MFYASTIVPMAPPASPGFRNESDLVDWIMQRLAEPAPPRHESSGWLPETPTYYPAAYRDADQKFTPAGYPAPDARSWRDVADGIVALLEREEAERAADAAGGLRRPDGSYDVAGGPSNRMEADPDATGPHSVFKRKPPETGPVTDYETYWEKNPRTGEWEPKIRYRGTGKPHYNNRTKQNVYPPLIHEYDPHNPNPRLREITRPALPNEMPARPPSSSGGGGGGGGSFGNDPKLPWRRSWNPWLL